MTIPAETPSPQTQPQTGSDSALSDRADHSAAQTVWPSDLPEPKWQQGEMLKVAITDLTNSGDGVGRWEDRVVFVPNTVPGDVIRVKMTKVKETHGFGIPAGIVQPSPQRVRPACIVADKCGGCQWQQVSYEQQLISKRDLVVDALTRIGKLENVQVDPVMASEQQLGYRNKATYPLGRSQINTVQAGYYRKGSHRLVNLNQCPVQDPLLDPLLAEVKADIEAREWKIYDERLHKGHLKHLSLRVGRRTGQVLLTLISRSVKLKGIHEQAEQWMARYPNLAGVLVNLNWKRTNAIFGPDTYGIAGQSYLEEEFAGLTFHIQPSTFFQVNTEQAERLLRHVQTELALTGEETLVDAYCGVGTFTLPLAQQVKQCIGLEAFAESVKQAEENAVLNKIENVAFKIGDVAELMPQLEVRPDVVLLDPPRKGCDPAMLEALINLKPERIVYISCNPATLARDLQVLCDVGKYRLTRVQPADFFPQTSHVECAAFLVA
ncbi:MAG: 23S rRNA (uracil(1939)-C(5))-methyltransferase RlmD [Phormidesmis priestleyi]|uniref:23S rRNA (Uracil(1939)-C(5))-methyltransferase RlmD n=1 Tax=Phormidesmis priestleyi TaxID=268141 RepID=A0A2W4ZQN5_9CYAN|nr:MAG: 23S rRNA (uracil(1939)-C(5))-methyltransferase RlmD [Phormidesmis priestleyi]